jgi:phosphoserine phosphatase
LAQDEASICGEHREPAGFPASRTVEAPCARPIPAPQNPATFFQALDEHPAADLVVVDFDETLWLRNSTEEFLSSVRPRFLAAIVLQMLGMIKPWRLLQRGSPNHYRDWIRVLAVMIVAPWSLWLWRRKAAELGPRYVNRRLLDAIERRQGWYLLVSFGFREIVEPLLGAIDPRLQLRESCSFRSGAALRKEGKASALRRHVGPELLARALVITDSDADSDLLQASAKPFLVQWPDAHYEQAGLKPLMPFVYLQRVKRPDENYLRNAILGHDLPVLLLAYAAVSPEPVTASIAILLFVLSFFTAYETGYHENDRLGLLLERRPKVSANYHLLGKNFSPAFAWTCAILFAGVASLLSWQEATWVPATVRSGILGFLDVWLAFVAFLVGMRLLFRWQNVIEPKGRIVPMLGLQVGRVLGYALIFPITVIGVLFCIAHGLSRWIPYMIYRFGGTRRDVPNHLNCLMLLLLLAGGVAIGAGTEFLLTWQSGLIFAYAGLRAAKDMLSFAPRLVPLRRAADLTPDHHGAPLASAD